MGEKLGSETNELSGWERFWANGQGYLRTCEAGVKDHRRFNPSILYNLLCMAIEGFFMGAFASHGEYPDNHALRDLVSFAEGRLDLAPALKATLIEMNDFQQICSLEFMEIKNPTWDDIDRFLVATRALKETFEASLPQSA